MRLEWNTGRAYSVHGQRMVAKTQKDGTILFADLDRSISGLIERPTFGFTERSEALMQEHIMVHYDAGDYRCDSAASDFCIVGMCALREKEIV